MTEHHITKQEITDILESSYIKHMSKIYTQNNIIINNLEGVNKHLEKLNSKIAKHEVRLNTIETDDKLDKQKHDIDQQYRANTCPLKEGYDGRLGTLETTNKVIIGRRQLIIAMIATISMVLGIAVATININKAMSEKQTETITKQIDTK